MLRRKKLSRKANKRNFTRKASKLNGKNIPKVVARGGIRL